MIALVAIVVVEQHEYKCYKFLRACACVHVCVHVCVCVCGGGIVFSDPTLKEAVPFSCVLFISLT